MDLHGIKGKTAVVTGAASGMGLLLCQELVRRGANAVLADIDPEAAEKAAQAINAESRNGGRAISAACDVRRYDEVCAVRDLAVSTFGCIDILVTLAGGAEMRMCHAEGEFPDVPIEVYDWGLDVNLKGQFYFAHAVMKQMREQKSGTILCIGSITGWEGGGGGSVAYACAKSAAMNGLVRSLAQYGSQYGIRCCCVAPGPVLTRPGMASMPTALKRAAEPIELVNLMLYLIADEGNFFDGVTLLMDGGRSVL